MKKIIITEGQYNNLMEVTRKTLTPPPDSEIWKMQAYGITWKVLLEFIDALTEYSIEIESLIGLFTEKIYIDEENLDRFKDEYKIIYQKKLLELNGNNKYLLDYYVNNYLTFTSAFDYESLVSELVDFLLLFNVTATKERESIVQRPVYELKTSYSRTDEEKVPNNVKCPSDMGCRYYEFTTYKDMEGYINFAIGPSDYLVRAYNQSGGLIGKVWVGYSSKFNEVYHGSLSSDSTMVDKKYRRMGVMSAMYDLLQVNGVYVIPSSMLKSGTKMFWQNRKILNIDRVSDELLKYIDWTTNTK